MKKIAIIGGGPAGLTASYQIKKNHPSYQVVLFEKDNQLGKRIKVSGNGRCNITNEYIHQTDYYNGDKIYYILDYFKRFEKDFYAELNLHLYADEEGRVYPLTNNSKTIQKAFISALKRVGVEIKLEEKFLSLINDKTRFVMKTNKGEYSFDKVVFASGGASYLYQEEDVYSLIKNIPYSINLNKLNPCLCPLKVKEKIDKNCVGKRANVKVTLYKNSFKIFEEKGEIIFKKDGISGIVIFNASRFINLKDNFTLKLNFIEGISREQILKEEKIFSKREVIESYVVEEIGEMILSKYKDVYQGLSEFVLHVDSLYPFKESQVTRGGVDLTQLNNDLSLKNNNNLYFAGELLDVDGKCGGYNIFFALASGFFIGNKII